MGNAKAWNSLHWCGKFQEDHGKTRSPLDDLGHKERCGLYVPLWHDIHTLDLRSINTCYFNRLVLSNYYFKNISLIKIHFPI